AYVPGPIPASIIYPVRAVTGHHRLLEKTESEFILMIETSVIGSYAWPSWVITAVEAIKSGAYGPRDIEETMNDAVDVALRDQEDAGVDIVTDGELRRLGFFTADFYGRLTGLRSVPPERRIGPPGHDQRERYEAIDPIQAPNGL